MRNINSISHIRSNTCGLHVAVCQIYVRVFSPETFLKQKHFFSLLASSFTSLTRRRLAGNGRSLRKLTTHGHECGIPVLPFSFSFFLFFSTHCSRFFGISAICPGMSAKEEKRPILFLCSAGLEGLPGYQRLCANTRTNKRTVADYIKTLLHSCIHTGSMTNSFFIIYGKQCRRNILASLLSLFCSPLLWTHQRVRLRHHLQQHPGALV